MDDELISFKNVNKRFGKKVVLDSVSFTVPENKITGIIGASGEGKTTILKLIVDFYKPDGGSVMYSKRKISHDAHNIKNTFGFATEDGSFHENLTVYENIVHFGHLHHVPKKEIVKRMDNLLKIIGLEEAKDTLARNLSMGMKKRLDVAISLIHDPKVLIMDEPTADLDPLLREHMLELIKKINEGGTTIILTTQLLGEMDKVCDKIAILFDKNIVESGNPADIKKKYDVQGLDEVFNKIFSQERNVKREKVKEKPVKAAPITVKDEEIKEAVADEVHEENAIKEEEHLEEAPKEMNNEKSDKYY